jgi:hypothetical protein
MARAVYRGYPASTDRRSARVTRLHVIREDGPGGRMQTWCGQGAGSHRNSEPVILDPLPARPPDGLKWCPMCVGHLAEVCGVLDEVAARLAVVDGPA